MLSFNYYITLYCKVQDTTCLAGDVPGFDWYLAIDSPNKNTLFCYDVILVMQILKVHDIRHYNNHNLQMLEQGQTMSSVGETIKHLLVINIIFVQRASFCRTIC